MPLPPADQGISVVVCSRDRPEQLQVALAAIVGVLRSEDELVVVDSASRSAETGKVIAEQPRAVAVRCDEPGLSKARNAGIAASTRSLILFTDDDCEPDAGWIEAIEAGFADARTAAVTGAVLAKGEGSMSAINRSDSFVTDTYPHDFSKVLGHGANMAWRRSVLKELDGFDESLGAGAVLRAADDWDVLVRALRAGYVLRYLPGAVIHHHQWRSTREATRTRFGYSIGAAALAVKLGRLGGPLDRKQRRMLLTQRLQWGAHEIVGGVLKREWERCAGGVANIAGAVRGTVLAHRTWR